MTGPGDPPRAVVSPLVPAVLFVLSAGFVLWTQRYGEVARLVPTIMGTATAVLCLLDFLSRFDTRLARALRIALGADFRNREMSHDPRARDEMIQASWVIACVLLMLMIGILPTIPLFVLAYMRLQGDRPWLQSAISAAAVLAFVVLVFELLLDYTLYRGVIFDPRGFGAW